MLEGTGGRQMARTLAELPKGARITDYVSLGVLTSRVPLDQVKRILAATGKASLRQRDCRPMWWCTT